MPNNITKKSKNFRPFSLTSVTELFTLTQPRQNWASSQQTASLLKEYPQLTVSLSCASNMTPISTKSENVLPRTLELEINSWIAVLVGEAAASRRTSLLWSTWPSSRVLLKLPITGMPSLVWITTARKCSSVEFTNSLTTTWKERSLPSSVLPSRKEPAMPEKALLSISAKICSSRVPSWT